MDEEFEREIDEDFDWESDDDLCEGCGKPFGDGKCPLCCNFGGIYSPGCEECDWCRYNDECRKTYERLFRIPKKKTAFKQKSRPKAAP